MKIKVSRKLISYILAGSIVFTPVSAMGGVDRMTFVDSDNSIYPDWFKYNEKADYYDDIYQAIISNQILLYLLENSKYNIKVVEKENLLEEKFDMNKFIIGITVNAERTIYIEGFKRNVKERYKDKKNISKLTNDELSKRISLNILYHEFGHLLDFYMGKYTYYNNGELRFLNMPSFGLEFKNIYEKDIINFKKTKGFTLENNYVIDNVATSSEYFAQAFATYILYPEELKELCPDTYNYYVKIINEMFNTKSELFEYMDEVQEIKNK